MTADQIGLAILSIVAIIVLLVLASRSEWLAKRDPSEPTLEQMETDWADLVAASKDAHSEIDRYRRVGERRKEARV